MGRTDSNIPCDRCGTELYKPYEMKWWKGRYLCPHCYGRAK